MRERQHAGRLAGEELAVGAHLVGLGVDVDARQREVLELPAESRLDALTDAWHKPVVIESFSEVESAYLAGRCDVYTTDKSGLASTRAARSGSVRMVPP